MSEIEHSAQEIYDAAKEVEQSQVLGRNQAVTALLWVIDEQDGRRHFPPFTEDTAIARSADEIEEQIEMVESTREKLYKQNLTSAANRMALAAAAYKWVLGKRDEIYQNIPSK